MSKKGWKMAKFGPFCWQFFSKVNFAWNFLYFVLFLELYCFKGLNCNIWRANKCNKTWPTKISLSEKTSTPSDGPRVRLKNRWPKNKTKKDERNWHKHDFPVKITNFRTKKCPKLVKKGQNYQNKNLPGQKVPLNDLKSLSTGFDRVS